MCIRSETPETRPRRAFRPEIRSRGPRISRIGTDTEALAPNGRFTRCVVSRIRAHPYYYAQTSCLRPKIFGPQNTRKDTEGAFWSVAFSVFFRVFCGPNSGCLLPVAAAPLHVIRGHPSAPNLIPQQSAPHLRRFLPLPSPRFPPPLRHSSFVIRHFSCLLPRAFSSFIAPLLLLNPCRSLYEQRAPQTVSF
jgi:hypothetical protein